MFRRICALSLGFLAATVIGCGHPKAAPPTAQETQEFQSALQDGDPMIVDRLLSAKPGLVNQPDSGGKTPLAIAREKGNEELAGVIKRHGGHE